MTSGQRIDSKGRIFGMMCRMLRIAKKVAEAGLYPDLASSFTFVGFYVFRKQMCWVSVRKADTSRPKKIQVKIGNPRSKLFLVKIHLQAAKYSDGSA